MSTNLPIIRDTRVRDLAAAVGQVAFTFDAPIFDAADLQVLVKTSADTDFVLRTSGYSVALLTGNVGATVTFATAPLIAGGATPVTVRLRGARVHKRLTDATRGGVVRSQALEAELDQQAIVLQELRRDADASVQSAQAAIDAAASAADDAASAAESAAEVAAGLVFATPIGTGAGLVPASIRERFRHFANVRTDFDVRMFENDGVTLRDNTSRLQAAFDAVQALGGSLFFPNEGYDGLLTGPLTMRDSAPYKGMPLALIGLGAGDPTHGSRNSYVGAPTQYTLGAGLKLKDGSAAALITSPAGAGHLVMERMKLNVNQYGQTAARRGVDFQDNLGALGYGFSGFFRQVTISDAGAAALYVGQARGMGVFEDTWVEHAGTDGGEPGWWQRCYDTQITRPGIGLCPGVGFLADATAQLEITGGAIWLCKQAMAVTGNAQFLTVTGTHFDGSTAEHIVLAKYTGAARASRKFVGCTFSRRTNFTDGSTADIGSSCNALSLIGCSFRGWSDGAGNHRPNYNLRFDASDARALVSGEDAVYTAANTAGFTNDYGRVVRWGDMLAATHRHDFGGSLYLRPNQAFDGYLVQALDDTVAAFLGSVGVGGKEGAMRLWDAAGTEEVRIGAGTGSGRQMWKSLPAYASDAAAGSAGLTAGDLFRNTTTGAVSIKS